MTEFDRLPRALRSLLTQALHSVEPVRPIREAYQDLVMFLPPQFAVNHIAQHLAQAEAVGIAKMARTYRAKTGRPYPHTEAGATIMRPTMMAESQG